MSFNRIYDNFFLYSDIVQISEAMKKNSNKVVIRYSIPFKRGEPAVTLTGELEDYSSGELHAHNCHQFLIIKNGVSLLIDEKMKQPLYGTMCAFLPAGFPHRTVVAGGSITYQSLYLKTGELSDPPEGIIIYSMSELALALFNRMTAEKDKGFVRGIMNDILSLFLRISMIEMQNRELSLSLPEPVSPGCRNVTRFIENNYMKSISQENFRSVLPYSTRHISRIFSAEMKMTPMDYLRIYRMIMASIMLHDREKSVLEVSLESGYESLSVFYSDFKRFFSQVPGDFRKRVTQ